MFPCRRPLSYAKKIQFRETFPRQAHPCTPRRKATLVHPRAFCDAKSRIAVGEIDGALATNFPSTPCPRQLIARGSLQDSSSMKPRTVAYDTFQKHMHARNCLQIVFKVAIVHPSVIDMIETISMFLSTVIQTLVALATMGCQGQSKTPRGKDPVTMEEVIHPLSIVAVTIRVRQ